MVSMKLKSGQYMIVLEMEEKSKITELKLLLGSDNESVRLALEDN